MSRSEERMLVAKRGFIRCYGLFWLRDEVEWDSGQGREHRNALLGRRGERSSALRLADFWDQRGIYVLYNDYGPYYVGEISKRPLGVRLHEHTKDAHGDSWDRFSWFGFRRVLKSVDEDGVRQLGMMPAQLLSDYKDTIGDVEALLIMSLGTHHVGNKDRRNFAAAEEWKHVWSHERDRWLSKARGGTL
jgi:hypothetical protein